MTFAADRTARLVGDERLGRDAEAEHLPAVVVIEPRIDIDEERARPFDGQQFLHRETGLLELSDKFVWPVHVG